MSERSPRSPSRHEEKEIARWLAKQEKSPLTQDHIDRVSNAYMAVFDDYMSDGPGHTGRVMVCVWPGGPELISVFVDATRIVDVAPSSMAIHKEEG